MQGRDQGNVPEEVSFINTQLSGRYVAAISDIKLKYKKRHNEVIKNRRIKS